jgi:predicted cupin superfamily sugar epimerase
MEIFKGIIRKIWHFRAGNDCSYAIEFPDGTEKYFGSIVENKEGQPIEIIIYD